MNKYHEQKGSYPDDLADLKSIRIDDVQFEKSGQVLDPWKNPYQYRADGASYALFSFGRDGKRGGVGPDNAGLAFASRTGHRSPVKS